MRIDKYLAHSGLGTRKEVKEIIKQGYVTLNGKTVRKPKEKVDPAMDEVAVSGAAIIYQEYVYFMMNKPEGVISATRDHLHMTAVDLLEPQDALQEPHPAGRLDKDTTGFLLLTNDGALSHALTNPNRKVPKVYQATVEGILGDEAVQRIAEGNLDIGEGDLARPGKLFIDEVDEEQGLTYVRIEITEGKYHQVKRMIQAVGGQVVQLHRLSIGGLDLDPTLEPGAYRPLEEEEILYLKSL